MYKILVVEDDIWISASLKLYLENSWYEVLLHNEWIEVINLIKRENPDLVILDINLPWKNGIDITKDIRKFSSLPIIMLTARSGEIDRISGLEYWADDYIAKPFSPRELLARIKTILRRISLDSEELSKKSEWENDIICQPVSIDDSKKIAYVNDVRISLTWNEYDILKKLCLEKWWLVSRDTIMKEIIGYDNYVYDRTIDTHIKNLRKKIWKKDFILTVRWEWYRINI